MKIYVSRVSPEGIDLEEHLHPQALDMEMGHAALEEPLIAQAHVSRITNALTVDLHLTAAVRYTCSRCLADFTLPLHKDLMLNYVVDHADQVIDLTPDIREAVMLEYVLQPLCRQGCLGLCLVCGKNLNEGGCSCGSTEKKAFKNAG